MLSKTAGIILLLLAPCALSRAGEEEVGRIELAPRESGVYRSHLPGEKSIRWSASWEMERIAEGPPARYVVTDILRGIFGEDDLEQTRTTRAEFLLERGQIRLLHSLLTVVDPAGKIIFTLDKKFDHAEGVVRTRLINPEQDEVEEETFEMGGRMVDNKEIVSFLRGFPFPEIDRDEPGQVPTVELNFLNETPTSHSVLVEYEGTEEVETPAGKFLCHRLRLVPDLGILTFLGRVLAPDFRMWFTVAPPHFWVKYNGLEGELGTEEIISELVEFQAGETTFSPAGGSRAGSGQPANPRH